jgi:site-specific recombinase XerD
MKMIDKLSTFENSLREEKHFSRNSILAYLHDVKEFLIEKEIDPDSLHSANTHLLKEKFEMYLLQLDSKNISLNSIARKASAINSYFSFQEVPIFVLPRDIFILNREEKPKEFLANDQLNHLHNCLQQNNNTLAVRDLVIFHLLAFEALSVRNIIFLNLKDYEIKKGLISPRLKISDTIRLSENTVEVLNLYLSESRKDLTKTAKENALMVSQLGTRISRQMIWLMCQNWKTQYNLDFSISPRVLVNSAILNLLKGNISDLDLKVRLGHKNILSTKSLIRKIKQ